MTEKDWSKPMDVNDVTLVFPGTVIGTLMPTMEEIPEEFRDREGPWHDLIAMLFFKGGKLPPVKEGIDATKAQRHLGACLGSFEPKHEHKTAACAWLASMWYTEPRQPDEGTKPL